MRVTTIADARMTVSVWKPHWRVIKVDGIGYCKQHSPKEQERRDNERRERIDASIKAMDRRNEATYARIRVFELVKELRDGGWVLTEELIAKLDVEILKTEP